MRVVDQADTGGDDIFRDGDRSGDVLIAGLGVVALMGDGADNVDTTFADQLAGAHLGQHGPQMMGDAVVFDDGAVAVGATV